MKQVKPRHEGLEAPLSAGPSACRCEAWTAPTVGRRQALTGLAALLAQAARQGIAGLTGCGRGTAQGLALLL